MIVNHAQAVVFAGLMPHPPIIVPAVARGRESEASRTIAAMKTASARLVQSGAETLVLISPHSPRRRGSFAIWRTPRVQGSFTEFGAPGAFVDLPNDDEFARKLEETCRDRGIETWRITNDELDHGALVPLYYLKEAGWINPTVVVGLNYPGEGQLEEMGGAIAAAAELLGRQIAVLASGDMSHRLKPSAPGGFHPRAREFDSLFIQLVEQGRYDEIRHFNADLQSIAGEDVVDSSIVALAAAGFDRSGHEVLNYEGPFGVGYSVAVFCDHAGKRQNAAPQVSGLRSLPGIARMAVESYVRNRRVVKPTVLDEELLNTRAAVFVTIRRKDGELRGCIGNLRPEFENIVEEVIDRAIATATSDTRFDPIEPGELDNLTYEVSVLHPPEPVASEDELDPAKYGIIVKDRMGRRAVMLPGIESLDTVEKQLTATKRKAGIPPDAQVTIERFEVEKLEE